MPSAGTITLTPNGNRLSLSPTADSYTNRKIEGPPATNNEHYICAENSAVAAFLGSNRPTLAINYDSFRAHLSFLYLEFFSNGQIFNPASRYYVPLDRSVWSTVDSDLQAYINGIPTTVSRLRAPNGTDYPEVPCRIRNYGSAGSDLHLSFTRVGGFARETNAIIRDIIITGVSQLSLLEIRPDEFLLEVDFVEGFATSISSLTYGTSSGSDEPRNLLALGAPGTGKSHYLEQKANDLVSADTFIKKVAFNPATSYSSFIGEYRPIMLYEEPYITNSSYSTGETKNSYPALPTYVTRDGTPTPTPLLGKPKIAYQFIPGPFSEALKLALDAPTENVVLLIDEINRGEIFETFGEVFQLMERYSPPSTRVGRYELPLAPEVMQYLGVDIVRLPENFYLWATMNPNDASVQVIDSAFIRRWTVDYYDSERSSVNDILSIPILNVSWESLRVAINNHLRTSGLVDFEPIGRWFVTAEDCSDWDRFYSKFIFYLANYVVRDETRLLFNSSSVEEIMADCRDANNPFDPLQLSIF